MVSFQSVIKELLQANSSEPVDMDGGFVVSHYVTDESFNFLVSSVRLLEHSVDAKVISADTTHKMLCGNIFATTFGKIREDGKMDLIAIGFSSKAYPCYEYMFNAIKEAATKYFEHLMCPDFLICDLQDIRNAFFTVFGRDVTILISQEHMRMTVKRKIQKLVPRQQHQPILEDIKVLQMSEDFEIFEKATLMFVKKYEDFKDFIDFFDLEWLQFNRNWMKVASNNAKARTNNGHEYIHHILKRNFNNRIPLEIFINLFLEWINVLNYEQAAASSDFVS